MGNKTELNQNITIYHGSSKELKTPIYGFGSSDNDYGSGFYTTFLREKADAWAITMGDGSDGVTNKYTINIDGLNIINLDNYGILTWIATILKNRSVKDPFHQLKAELLVEKYSIDLSKADIVIGYRADDSYMDIVEWFLDDKIDVCDVERLFRKGELGTQFFIQSEKAFERIQFVESYKVAYSEELLQDEKKARKEVSRFINNRSRAIIIDRLEITGITATDAIDNTYIYDAENSYYYAATPQYFLKR